MEIWNNTSNQLVITGYRSYRTWMGKFDYSFFLVLDRISTKFTVHTRVEGKKILSGRLACKARRMQSAIHVRHPCCILSKDIADNLTRKVWLSKACVYLVSNHVPPLLKSAKNMVPLWVFYSMDVSQHKPQSSIHT